MVFRIKEIKKIGAPPTYLVQSQFDAPDAWSPVGKACKTMKDARWSIRHLRAMHPIGLHILAQIREEHNGEDGDWYAYAVEDQASPHLGEMIFLWNPEYRLEVVGPTKEFVDDDAVFVIVGRVSLGTGSIHPEGK